MNPSEIAALVGLYFQKTPQIPQNITPNQRFCYDKLVQVSRRWAMQLALNDLCSFSAVILALPPELRESICLFYLVCRGLDTVEDDMKPTPEVKVSLSDPLILSKSGTHSEEFPQATETKGLDPQGLYVPDRLGIYSLHSRRCTQRN
jgi:hypothetical protein